MKKITILTIFPEMFTGFLNTSIIKKARLKQLADISAVDFRTYTKDKHNRVDDYPFGGGQGMVLMCQPLLDALKDVRSQTSHVVLMDPAGAVFNQAKAHQLQDDYDDLIIMCGHYEGYDYRISQYADELISIGDFILTGGEIGAMVLTDAVTRLIPGVITDESTMFESFEDGLLEYPQYTRPENYEGCPVPEVLLSGHHENIRQWRLYQSLKRTWQIRPDLLENRVFSKEEAAMMQKIRAEQDSPAPAADSEPVADKNIEQ